MRGPHVRFCERRDGAIHRAYSTGDRGGGADPAAIAAQATKHREAALAAGRTLTVAQAVDEVMSGAAQIKQGSGA